MRSRVPAMSMPDEGYPTARTNDGVNVARIAGREGYQKNLGTDLDEHTVWTNSKTGAVCDPPDYASED